MDGPEVKDNEQFFVLDSDTKEKLVPSEWNHVDCWKAVEADGTRRYDKYERGGVAKKRSVALRVSGSHRATIWLVYSDAAHCTPIDTVVGYSAVETCACFESFYRAVVRSASLGKSISATPSKPEKVWVVVDHRQGSQVTSSFAYLDQADTELEATRQCAARGYNGLPFSVTAEKLTIKE